jgi:SAM-dependent methyltransferase
MKKKLCIPLMAILLLAAPGSTTCVNSRPLQSGQATPASTRIENRLDVPYVPTPKNVVNKMIEMAKVGPDDTVYDLGCGDGRLVITAAKEKGAKGVGVDLNPARIKESNENAAKAKVKDRVTFLEQDLFKTDISKATVLTMYLLPRVNLMLRPVILSQLKPGSRVVSHDFDMGDWKPDDTAFVGSARIFYWVVPANVSGTWELAMNSGEGSRRYTLIVDQNFQEVDGIASSGFSQAPIKNANLKGEALEFEIEQRIDGKLVPMKFEGWVVGDSIEGTMRQHGKTKGERIAWNAERDPATAVPIDSSPQERKYAGRR